MHTEICDRLGIEFPIFAFTHCRDVVAAVSNAGGIGVLGAIGFSPEELEVELAWLDDHVGDNPYGVDIVIPGKYEGMGEMDPAKLESQLQSMVPDDHRRFARRLLDEHGIAAPPEDERRSGMMGWTEATAKPLLDCALDRCGVTAVDRRRACDKRLSPALGCTACADLSISRRRVE